MTTESRPAIDDRDPAYLADPYPALAAARAHGPAYRDPLSDALYLFGHDDIQAVLRNHAYSRDPHKALPGTRYHRLSAGSLPHLLTLDPPAHTRLRGLVTKAFTPRAIEALRPRVQARCDELLDAVADRSEFDLIPVLAAPLPTLVIAELLGVDPGEYVQFKTWSDAVAFTFDPFLTPEQHAEVEQNVLALAGYFFAALAARRTQPTPDLLTALITAQEGDDRLADLEIASLAILLLVAGNVTTSDLIGNGVHALLEHPGQWARLQAEPALLPGAIEEMLRYDPPVVWTLRVPLADEAFHGCPLRAGETLVTSLAAANRDPAIYPEPDQFDITRADVHHQSFGGGTHFCLGAPLARMEAQIAIASLLGRFPHLRLAPDIGPERRQVPGFRGFQSLPVAV
jgi:cytochrome P450